jgi:hypothetical protein
MPRQQALPNLFGGDQTSFNYGELFWYPNGSFRIAMVITIARLIICLLIILSLTSCGRFLTGLMGLHFYQKEIKQEQIDRMRTKMGLQGTDDLYLTEAYYDQVKAMSTTNDRFQQALVQPLQLRYFDRKGDLVSLVANCHVGGFPNLKWERFHIVDSLPIKKTNFLDSMWTLAGDQTFLRSYSGGPISERGTGEYHVNVYWSYRMGRQFKRLKRTVDQMQARHRDKVTVWYVNIDPFYKRIEDNASAAADL